MTCSRLLLFALLVLASACSTPASARRDEALTVRELTVVDEKGTPRLRLGAPLPDPKGMKRAVKIVGLQLGLIQGQPSITFRQDWKDRIVLGVEQGVATITVNDGQGNPKLKLQVEKDGQTRVEGVGAAPR